MLGCSSRDTYAKVMDFFIYQAVTIKKHQKNDNIIFELIFAFVVQVFNKCKKSN